MALGLRLGKNTAYLITDEADILYFSGVKGVEGTLCLGEEKIYFTDARYFHELKALLSNTDVIPLLYKGADDIRNYLLDKGVKTLYLDYDKTTVSTFKTYKKFGIKIKDGGQNIAKARSIKSANELSLIKKSCGVIEKAVKRAIDNLAVGKTELEVADEIEKEIIRLGGDGVSFDTIVAFGKNSAIPHHVPSSDQLEKDTVVLIDAGAKYKGYSSDITRTIYFGKNPSDEFKLVYNAVLTSNQLAIDNIKCGMTFKDADKIARDYLDGVGYGKYFTHSLGHGLGLEIHEYPRLSPKGVGKLKNGTVFTIEPGVYLNGEFGVRIEDTVVLKNGKVQRLFTDSKELLVK